MDQNQRKPIELVCLCKAVYLPKHYRGYRVLNSSERKELQRFFETKITSKKSRYKGLTGWEAAVEIWKDGIKGDDYRQEVFDKLMYKKKGKLVDMPDYTELREPNNTDFLKYYEGDNDDI